MKRTCILLLAAVILFRMTGCGATDIDPQEKNFSFTYNGTGITLGAEAAPIIDALGEPRSYTEEPSCAFDGMDRTYYYGSFYLSTYSMDGKEFVYSFWFADDSVATEEGVRIGNTQADVEFAYGTDCFNGTNTYTQSAGNSKLTIILTDGFVTSIQYEISIACTGNKTP